MPRAKARDFALKGIAGKTYSLADVRGPKGTLAIFICNHCPYVKASIDRIVSEAKALNEMGIGTVAIMSNDTAAYREDSFENMKAFAARHGVKFGPYVIDETQEVVRNRLPHHLAATPHRAHQTPVVCVLPFLRIVVCHKFIAAHFRNRMRLNQCDARDVPALRTGTDAR